LSRQPWSRASTARGKRGQRRETTINELVTQIGRATGRRVNTVVRMDESGGVSRLVSDNEMARQKLGVTPRVDLENGLARMLSLDRSSATSRNTEASNLVCHREQAL